MSKPIKFGLIIFGITVLAILSLFAYKFLSESLVDNTNYLKLGNDQLSAGQYSSALASYQKAMVKNSSNPEVYLKIAKIYEIKNRFSDATDILKKGINQKKDNADLNYQLGQDLSILAKSDPNQIQNAIDAYLVASTSDSYRIFATYKAARLISSKTGSDNTNKAKEMYINLGNFQPAKYELVLYSIDNPDEALNLLKEAENTPASTNQDQLMNVIDFHKNLSEQINAVKQDITSKKKAATVFNDKGYVAYRADRCEFGLDFLKNAISESEKDVPYYAARLVLGECLKRLQKYDEAKSIVQTVYDNNKDSIEARLILRHVYRGLSDNANMKKMYEELIALDGQNTTIRYDYAQDMELISDWSTAANQYAWLGQNLSDKSTVGNLSNADYSLNDRFLTKAYEIYVYKVKDLETAQSMLDNAVKTNDKFINSQKKDELIAWIKYLQKTTDKNLENDLLSKAQNLNTADALYHVAFISKTRGDNKTAKSKALQSYDIDSEGYVGPMAADILNTLEK